MPRADRVSLTPDGLDMPTVDDLSNRVMNHVVLDRHLSHLPKVITASREPLVLFMLFARLTDKALREYDAARFELYDHWKPAGLNIGPYLRAVDHVENCVSATHRAVLTAKALRDLFKIGRGAPRLTELQERRLSFFRNAFEHADERVTGTTKSKKIPPFTPADPYSIRLANKLMVVGDHVLRYAEVVSAMTKCHRTVEIIYGRHVDPTPDYPNAQLRTTDPHMPKPTDDPGSMMLADFFRGIARLGVSHA